MRHAQLFLAVALSMLSFRCAGGSLGQQCAEDGDCARNMFCGMREDGGARGQCTAECSQDQDCPDWNRVSPRAICAEHSSADAGLCQRAPPN